MSRGRRITLRFLAVWRRNFIVYQRIWKVNFLPPMLEPLLFLLAFGLGIGGMVGQVEYAGQVMSYPRFIAPALIATAMMQHSFFETTFSSFVRMYYQKTFDAMLATPLTLEEIILAEVVWGATKALFAVCLMLGVVSFFGYFSWPSALLVLPLGFLGGLVFASVGMYFTAITPSIDMFNLPIFLFITPMFLFSGTFFPVDSLPGWAQILAKTLPLYHLAELSRQVLFGLYRASGLYSLAYLLICGGICLPLCIKAMRKRLIK